VYLGLIYIRSVKHATHRINRYQVYSYTYVRVRADVRIRSTTIVISRQIIPTKQNAYLLHTHHRRDNGMHWITYIIHTHTHTHTHTTLIGIYDRVKRAFILSRKSHKNRKSINVNRRNDVVVSYIRNNNNNIVYCRENGLHKYISQMVITSAYTLCRYIRLLD